MGSRDQRAQRQHGAGRELALHAARFAGRVRRIRTAELQLFDVSLSIVADAAMLDGFGQASVVRVRLC